MSVNALARTATPARQTTPVGPELSVVSVTRPRRSGVLAKIAGLIAVVGILVSLLGISTLEAKNALEMGELHEQLTVLQEQNQSLTDHLNQISSATSLAQRATAQGMVPNANYGYLTLETQEMNGGSPAW